MAIILFALFHIIYEIFANQAKYKKFDIGNESLYQGEEKRDLYHSTGNVQLYKGDLFTIVAIRQLMFTQKITHLKTHIQTHKHTHRHLTHAPRPKLIFLITFSTWHIILTVNVVMWNMLSVVCYWVMLHSRLLSFRPTVTYSHCVHWPIFRCASSLLFS